MAIDQAPAEAGRDQLGSPPPVERDPLGGRLAAEARQPPAQLDLALLEPAHRSWSIALGTLALAIAILMGCAIGAVPIPQDRILATVAGYLGIQVGTPLDEIQSLILTELRLPRVLLAAVVGGTLACAGATYQGVFRNPLADPYLLGSAAGAGLGATVAIGYGLPRWGVVVTVPLAAFIGSLSGVGLTYAVAGLTRRGHDTAIVLLAGIAVGSFLTAIQTVVQQAHAETLREVYGWLLGQLTLAQWGQVQLIAPYVLLSVVLMLICSRALDVLALGDDEASSVGMNPNRVRLLAITAASLGTAAVVSVSGLIGFVGLVVPHVVRRMAGGSYRVILPVSLLAGAAFVVLADTLARSVMAPTEIPLGVVTAFVGAPFFAGLLRRDV